MPFSGDLGGAVAVDAEDEWHRAMAAEVAAAQLRFKGYDVEVLSGSTGMELANQVTASEREISTCSS